MGHVQGRHAHLDGEEVRRCHSRVVTDNAAVDYKLHKSQNLIDDKGGELIRIMILWQPRTGPT